MAAYVRIVHHWDDDTATSVEVGTEDVTHPDLLDKLAARALTVWRVTCAAGDGD